MMKQDQMIIHVDTDELAKGAASPAKPVILCRHHPLPSTARMNVVPYASTLHPANNRRVR
jgi:hypothetical protein